MPKWNQGVQGPGGRGTSGRLRHKITQGKDKIYGGAPGRGAAFAGQVTAWS